MEGDRKQLLDVPPIVYLEALVYLRLRITEVNILSLAIEYHRSISKHANRQIEPTLLDEILHTRVTLITTH